jgi:hypothetical protein
MSNLPTVDFCGLQVTRLVLGANPFGGFSHQSKDRSKEMVAYYTVDRIKETWARAEAAGINTFISNNETPHVVQAVREYLAEGGKMNWIAQVTDHRRVQNMFDGIDQAVEMGCKAIYFHGGRVDRTYREEDPDTVSSWCNHARAAGVPVGVAGHDPRVHMWVDSLGIADFHAVCFFNCGSLHDGKGHMFKLSDIHPAAECTQKIEKPCIAYKILGAGRIDPRMGFEYAFSKIKDTDIVNVGMHRGDKDDMVEENAEMVREILSAALV